MRNIVESRPNSLAGVVFQNRVLNSHPSTDPAGKLAPVLLTTTPLEPCTDYGRLKTMLYWRPRILQLMTVIKKTLPELLRTKEQIVA